MSRVELQEVESVESCSMWQSVLKEVDDQDGWVRWYLVDVMHVPLDIPC